MHFTENIKIFRRQFLYLNLLFSWQETVENYLHRSEDSYRKKNVNWTKLGNLSQNITICATTFQIDFSPEWGLLGCHLIISRTHEMYISLNYTPEAWN